MDEGTVVAAFKAMRSHDLGPPPMSRSVLIEVSACRREQEYSQDGDR